MINDTRTIFGTRYPRLFDRTTAEMVLIGAVFEGILQKESAVPIL